MVQALLDLYTATGGTGWTNATNWGVGEPCIDGWYGVYCCPVSMPHLICANCPTDQQYCSRVPPDRYASYGRRRRLVEREAFVQPHFGPNSGRRRASHEDVNGTLMVSSVEILETETAFVRITDKGKYEAIEKESYHWLLCGR